MFTPKKLNNEEIEIITGYRPEDYTDLQEYLNTQSIGMGDLEFNLPGEKFAERMQHENFVYFLLIKYQKQIITFSLGLKPQREDKDDKIESIIAIHRKHINLNSIEIIVKEIAAQIKKLNQNEIRIRWWMSPTKMWKCNRYFKKLGFSIIQPWELSKQL